MKLFCITFLVILLTSIYETSSAPHKRNRNKAHHEEQEDVLQREKRLPSLPQLPAAATTFVNPAISLAGGFGGGVVNLLGGLTSGTMGALAQILNNVGLGSVASPSFNYLGDMVGNGVKSVGDFISKLIIFAGMGIGAGEGAMHGGNLFVKGFDNAGELIKGLGTRAQKGDGGSYGQNILLEKFGLGSEQAGRIAMEGGQIDRSNYFRKMFAVLDSGSHIVDGLSGLASGQNIIENLLKLFKLSLPGSEVTTTTEEPTTEAPAEKELDIKVDLKPVIESIDIETKETSTEKPSTLEMISELLKADETIVNAKRQDTSDTLLFKLMTDISENKREKQDISRLLSRLYS